MKKLKGKSLMARVNNRTVALATSCSFTATTQFEDAQTKDDAEGPANEPTWVDWNGSSENMVGINESQPVQLTYAELLDLQLSKTVIDLSFDLVSNAEGSVPEEDWKPDTANVYGFAPYGGKAYIESVNLNAPNNGKATFSVAFKAAGPLSKIKTT